ncbi:hypothetical protein [Spirosoma sp. 209]|uniref:hypothetical protein n=1 Tax=Spirosoma sp. 209 TaxID=1955701 RepID=UPI0011167E00|nr:hypothetical protein [Spirosoma sp. 209]
MHGFAVCCYRRYAVKALRAMDDPAVCCYRRCAVMALQAIVRWAPVNLPTDAALLRPYGPWIIRPNGAEPDATPTDATL